MRLGRVSIHVEHHVYVEYVVTSGIQCGAAATSDEAGRTELPTEAACS